MDGVIIPRWEWRTFAENLDVEGAGVLSQGEAKLKESKEVYRPSRRSNKSTKTLAT